MVWYDVSWYGMVVLWCVMVRCRTVWYSMVWYGMVWYYMVWRDMVRSLCVVSSGVQHGMGTLLFWSVFRLVYTDHTPFTVCRLPSAKVFPGGFRPAHVLDVP